MGNKIGVNIIVPGILSKVGMSVISKEIIKFIIALLIVLMLVTFVPVVTTVFL